ncbi:MAG: AAA family ATPase [Acidobacteriota bacterium]
MTKQTMTEQYAAARMAAVPLLAINTPDPSATIQQIYKISDSSTPLFQWDIINGLTAVPRPSDADPENPAKRILTNFDLKLSGQLVKTLGFDYPESSVIFIHNAQRYLADNHSPLTAAHIQAIWNLRDIFESRGCTLVLLAPHLTLPVELSDVVVIDEPLPDDEQIKEIVEGLAEAADSTLEPKQVVQIVNTMRGVSAFTVKQVMAMAINPEDRSVNFESLKERQRLAIESTPGLTVSRSGIKFDDLGGLAEGKAFMRDLINGEEPFQAVAFIDEIDRLFAGGMSGSDTSGTSQDAVATFLTQTSQMNAIGLLIVGMGGTGKSALSEAVGNEAGVTTICFDTGSMKGNGLVGQAEQSIRAAFKKLRAISNDQVLLIGTTNNIDRIPGPIQRRFSLGVIYVDLPDAEERAAIWPVWLKKFNITEAQDNRAEFSDEGWSGDDIRRCCQLAFKTRRTLAEASARIVPLSKSNPDEIKCLREQADRRFLSASYPGPYLKDRQAMTAPARTRRIGKGA